jgi:hypothetical protein
MTPSEALRHGFWTVKLPSMTLLLGPIGAYLIAAKLKVVPTFGTAGMLWAVPAFLIAFVGGWLVWSIQIPKWRLWAYERVDDIDALEEAAVGVQLIWPKGSIFERTEIASANTWARIRALEAAKRKRVTSRFSG